MASYRAFQIAFDEVSLNNIDTSFAVPFKTNRAQPFFENKYMVDLVNMEEHKETDYFAVLSHKFFVDTTDKQLNTITRNKIESGLGDTDVLSFFAFQRENFQMFKHAERVHTGIDVCYRELFKALGLIYNPLTNMRFVVYRNCFFAKSEVFERYIKEMLEPCIKIMSDLSNKALQTALWKDSAYPYAPTRFRNHDGLRERFQRDMGVPYYPFHTFVLERMFSYWLNLNPEITCKHI